MQDTQPYYLVDRNFVWINRPDADLHPSTHPSTDPFRCIAIVKVDPRQESHMLNLFSVKDGKFETQDQAIEFATSLVYEDPEQYVFFSDKLFTLGQSITKFSEELLDAYNDLTK